jgi:hypothetical protein
MRKRVVLVVVFALLCVFWNATIGSAQTKLGQVFKNIYGPRGLLVESEAVLAPGDREHFPHFNNAFQLSFTAFNTELASQLTAVPLPSPASGFTYQYDAASGAFTRSTQSFGPILADRAETLGRRKVTISFNYQRYSFDAIEGVSLDSVPAVFTHDSRELGGGRLDVVTTKNSIAATVNQFTAFFNYGVADRVDVSVAVPTVPKIHFYGPPGGPYGTTKSFQLSGTETGIGDLIFRVKGTAVRRENVAFAVGSDFRAPTGDEERLLGSGAPGVKPFAVLSFTHGAVSPHVNVGYQWNGNSVLAGDVALGTKAGLPDQFLYTAGVDVSVARRLTLAFDFLGQSVIHSPRLVESMDTFSSTNGPALVTPNIQFRQNQNFSVINGAAGFKLNPVSNLLVGVNLLFKLNNAGLRDKATPLIGVEYSF